MPTPDNPKTSPLPAETNPAPVPAPAPERDEKPIVGAAPGESPPPSPPIADEEEPLDESLPIPQGDQAKAILEALLFSSTSPLSDKRLGRLLNGVAVETVRQLIEQLRADYSQSGRGVTLMEVAGGYQLATQAEYSEWIYRLHRHRKRSPLTPAVLETLAIIAYKQPIVRADIEAIRGVDCGGILRQLQDSGLVEIVGRREVVGRPPLYGTSELFLKTFGLRRLGDLPSLEELQLLLMRSDESIAGQGDLFPNHKPDAGTPDSPDSPDSPRTDPTADATEAPDDAAGDLSNLVSSEVDPGGDTDDTPGTTL
jgi:segregation and condensation protein B